ncbi:wax ester/triacylglycerol synthase family O-acyltransferase [Ramlibacter sp. CrO1]|uniref:diacylglycerol O-acyltransferase n=2 Tax=Ramlibacter algicola TaxID=2795217 RepID=A0A934PZF7_9BURK|nr:wax ester/triacylglycerol synthase family O-acyltransferase [Ramlibacter algicola]MBK0391923.1 wax ester/triacylglycerol synthase family O-acyltransferase [Ramlibacter algicola]
MTKVDTAWLRMDSDHNLMMIMGVWTLEPRVDYDQLCARVQERLVQYARFRQKVVEDAAGATWVEDRAFDIHRHVVREKLPRTRKGGSGQAALQARVGELAMQPLDRGHPLWQFHLVEDHDGGSALIARIHHCIADGIALISVMLSMVDGGTAAPPARQERREERDDDWIGHTLVKPITEVAVKALDAAGDGAAASLKLLMEPHKGVDGTLEAARLAYQVLSDAAALLLMPDDATTRLKGQPAGKKHVAWCEPLPLDHVRAVSKALNCSINDVLLSCVAGAIGQYLRRHGDDTTGMDIRAMVPVNLRPLDQAHKLGNRFGLVPLVLPVGVENPIERVYEVRRRMDQLKGSTQPMLAFLVLTLSGLVIKPVQDAILDLFGKKTTAVMTNVPGPREKLKILGSTLQDVMFWVPQSGNIGLGVSILSYGGRVQFGLIADAALCPRPQEIIDGFTPEFDRLALVTLMLPWGE